MICYLTENPVTDQNHMHQLNGLFRLLHRIVSQPLAIVHLRLGTASLKLPIRVTASPLLIIGILQDQLHQIAIAHLQAMFNKRVQEKHVLTVNALSKETTAYAHIATKKCGSDIFLLIFKIFLIDSSDRLSCLKHPLKL